jgi:hypothetical protein
MTFSITTLSIVAISITTHSIMALDPVFLCCVSFMMNVIYAGVTNRPFMGVIMLNVMEPFLVLVY